MNYLILAIGLGLTPSGGAGDGYVMGAGLWTCEKSIKVMESGSLSEQGQLAGWILGRWSAATLVRDTAFVDTVEQVGAVKIVNATIDGCRESPQAPVYAVVETMIRNTK